MKKIGFIISITILVLAVMQGSFAKNVLQQDNDSVKLLNSLTEEARAVRSLDIPIEKADVTADTCRVKLLKYQFAEVARKEFPTVEISDVIKNPLILKGLFDE